MLRKKRGLCQRGILCHSHRPKSIQHQYLSNSFPIFSKIKRCCVSNVAHAQGRRATKNTVLSEYINRYNVLWTEIDTRAYLNSRRVNLLFRSQNTICTYLRDKCLYTAKRVPSKCKVMTHNTKVYCCLFMKYYGPLKT